MSNILKYTSIESFITEWGDRPDENNFPVSSRCDFESKIFHLQIAQPRKSIFIDVVIENFDADLSLRYPKWRVPDLCPDNDDYTTLINEKEKIEQENKMMREEIKSIHDFAKVLIENNISVDITDFIDIKKDTEKVLNKLTKDES